MLRIVLDAAAGLKEPLTVTFQSKIGTFDTSTAGF
jgi:hypothetical protein